MAAQNRFRYVGSLNALYDNAIHASRSLASVTPARWFAFTATHKLLSREREAIACKPLPLLALSRAQHRPERLHHRLALHQARPSETRRGVHVAGGGNDKGLEAQLYSQRGEARRQNLSWAGRQATRSVFVRNMNTPWLPQRFAALCCPPAEARHPDLPAHGQHSAAKCSRLVSSALPAAST